MANMSYCRFQNTLHDLRDCTEVLEHIRHGDESPLSEDELSAAKQLVHECAKLLGVVADLDSANDDDLPEMDWTPADVARICEALELANNLTADDEDR